ncbi:MAG: hypothetical protein HY293_00020 [Planctomycetes bacterium]|nr:hypothetical protein [Planctomycetota bacterium]
MDPRLGIAISILSAVAAAVGHGALLMELDFLRVAPPRDGVAWIEEPDDSTFEAPPRLRIEGSVQRLHISCGEPLEAEFWLANLTNRRIDLPLLSYLERTRRSWSGRFPSWIVEIRDEEGNRVELRPRYLLGVNQDPLIPLNFWQLPARGDYPLRHPLLPWVPRKPGIYTVRMALDLRALGDVLESGASPEALGLLDRAPRDFVVSEPVTFIAER